MIEAFRASFFLSYAVVSTIHLPLDGVEQTPVFLFRQIILSSPSLSTTKTIKGIELEFYAVFL